MLIIKKLTKQWASSPNASIMILKKGIAFSVNTIIVSKYTLATHNWICGHA